MWPFSSICESKARLTGKTVVVTGANSGIGKETTRDLYWRGARVILACRNLKKTYQAIKDIKNTPPSKSTRKQFQGSPGKLVVYQLDLTKFSSIRKCAKTLDSTEQHIHILINNAGVMSSSNEKTEDGYELQLQTNYLGQFLLTLLLLPKMKVSVPGCRIINVSSMLHSNVEIDFDDLNLDHSYTHLKAYRQSKLASILFAKKLACKLLESKIEGITTYSLHPGVIPTDITKNFDAVFFPGTRFLMRSFRIFFKTPELGAQTSINCAVDKKLRKETGLYYVECKLSETSNNAMNKRVASRLWAESLKIVGLPIEDDLEKLIEIIASDVLPLLEIDRYDFTL